MKPSIRRKKPEATRAELMTAAATLFAERGFGGTTTEAIAQRAGVNKAMISYHFGGKAALYEKILVDGMQQVTERLRGLVVSNRSADDLLREVLDVLADLHGSRPSLSAMLVREAMSGGQHLSDTSLALFLKVFGMVREVIDRGVRQDVFRPVDPLLTHLSVIGSVVFFFASTPLRERLLREGRLAVPAAPSPERYTEHLKDLFSRGLAAEELHEED